MCRASAGTFWGEAPFAHQDTEEQHTEFKDKPGCGCTDPESPHLLEFLRTKHMRGEIVVKMGLLMADASPGQKWKKYHFGVTSKPTDSCSLNTTWHFSTSNPIEHQSFHTTGPVNTPRRSPCPTHELNWGTANSTPQIPEQDYSSTGNTAQTSCLLLLALNTKPRFLCWLIFRMQKLQPFKAETLKINIKATFVLDLCKQPEKYIL